MVRIVLKDRVEGAYSSIEGCTLYCILKPFLSSDERVELSLKGFPAMSSSFFNSSFGRLIEENGIDKLKSFLKFTDVTQSHANLIRRYIDFYSLERRY